MANSESALNLLRNLAAVLDQIQEKTEIPLDFCVKAIQVLNIMSYNALPVVRMRIKETSLAESRNCFVVRCLLDRTQVKDSLM